MDAKMLERDMVQARLLSAIFSRAVKHQVVLKGGMAFHAIWGSPRYTKDIDLAQSVDQSLGGLQRLMRRAIADCAQGFLREVVVTEPKQTDTTARWKIHGVTASGTDIGFTVEVSRRGVPAGHIETRTFVPPQEALCSTVAIDVFDASALAASKIFALASPNRSAPRDLFDLDLLVRMEVRPDPKLFSGVADPAAMVREIWSKIEAMSWEHFSQEVLPFLPDAMRTRMDEAFFDAMRVRVGDAVESWMLEGPGCG